MGSAIPPDGVLASTDIWPLATLFANDPPTPLHTMNQDSTCHCGTGKPFSACCGPFIAGTMVPATAEVLMRSRYTAYSLGREDYLRDTWHPTTRRQDLGLDEPVNWIGLEIVRMQDGGPGDKKGLVEFVARYKVGGRAYRLHEVSRFVRRDGRWLYVDGEAGPSRP